jgi:methyl-accepting chemotaxis protein
MQLLDSIVESASSYQKLNALDNCVMICNAEGKIIHFLPAKTFDMRVNVGEQVASGGTLDECLKTKREVNKTLPKELYGITIKAISNPILDGSTLIGAVAMGMSLATQQILHESAETIAATSEQLTATTQELASSAMELAQDLNHVRGSNELILANLKKTDEILRFVSDVAANSNLLGLNAAIEAARAGEHGRGFAVVAEEIRKMAINSAESVKSIKEILQTIQSQTDSVVKNVTNAFQTGERQAAVSEEIAASMQQLASAASEVERIAQIV